MHVFLANQTANPRLMFNATPKGKLGNELRTARAKLINRARQPTTVKPP